MSMTSCRPCSWGSEFMPNRRHAHLWLLKINLCHSCSHVREPDLVNSFLTTGQEMDNPVQNWLLTVKKWILGVWYTTPSWCPKRDFGLEPLQFNWFCATMRLYTSLTQCNSTTAKKVLLADVIELQIRWLLVFPYFLSHDSGGSSKHNFWLRGSNRRGDLWTCQKVRGTRARCRPRGESSQWSSNSLQTSIIVPAWDNRYNSKGKEATWGCASQLWVPGKSCVHGRLYLRICPLTLWHFSFRSWWVCRWMWNLKRSRLVPILSMLGH